MNGACPVHRGARRRDFLDDNRGLEDSASGSAVTFRYRDANPAAVGQRPVKVPRKLVPAVAPGPVGIRKVGADAPYRLAQQVVLLARREIHASGPWVRPLSKVIVKQRYVI